MTKEQFKDLVLEQHRTYMKKCQWLVDIVDDVIELARQTDEQGNFKIPRQEIINQIIEKHGGEW